MNDETLRRAMAGDVAARNEVVMGYHTLMTRVCAQMANKFVNADDLMFPAFIGMLKAIETFDPDAGTSFRTWAWRRMRFEIIDELRNENVRLRGRAVFTRAFNDLAQANQRVPTTSEVAHHAGIPLYRAMMFVNLDDEPLDSDEVQNISSPMNTPEQIVVQRETRATLLGELDHLDRRNELIVYRTVVAGDSLRLVGGSLGISEARCCQLRKRAFGQLRRRLRPVIADLLA